MNINLKLIAQAISFALFILFTVKFVWPPLMKAIEERQKQIADGLAAGEQGKQQLEASGKLANEELGKARARAAEIIAHAEKRGLQMIEEAKNSAKAEPDRRCQVRDPAGSLECQGSAARAGGGPGGQRRRENPAARSQRANPRRAAQPAEAGVVNLLYGRDRHPRTALRRS